MFRSPKKKRLDQKKTTQDAVRQHIRNNETGSVLSNAAPKSNSIMSANHADFHNRYDSFLKQRSFNIYSQNSPHGASDNNFLGDASFIPNASLIPNTSPFDGNPVEVPASEPAA